ncbi:MAG: hypothetical protein EXS35_01040 [Pedosphaera sp.]|nr:hypothetical protein [Pedosphaera sp.]
MKLLPHLTLLMALTVCSVPAQSTNTTPRNARPQTIIERPGISATNGQTRVGTNDVRAAAHLDEFIGTLLSIDKQQQTVSIALAPRSW